MVSTNIVVIKVGKEVLTSPEGVLNLGRLGQIVQEVSDLSKDNTNVVLICECDVSETLLKSLFSECGVGLIPVPSTAGTFSPGTVAAIATQTEAGLEVLRSVKNLQPNSLIILTDSPGLFALPHRFDPDHPRQIRTLGRKGACAPVACPRLTRLDQAGVDALVEEMKSAAKVGVQSICVASGLTYPCLRSILARTAPMTSWSCISGSSSGEGAREQAVHAQTASRSLQSLSTAEREDILRQIADSLLKSENEILDANRKDVEIANQSDMRAALKNRLKITPEKLRTVAEGIRQLASSYEPIGKVISRIEVSPGLILQQETAPIGVLMVIFESRPDVLPQVSSLAIRSGNGLLLKGGSEARHSNRILHRIIGDAIETASKGKVDRRLIGLVETREEIKNLLALDDVIDLCIPRGSGKLVSYIQDNTKIPVLGHAEGLCHLYIDEFADVEKAVRLAVDSKTDYPAACNAAETLLLHSGTVASGTAGRVLDALRTAGVSLYGGPKASEKFSLDPCTSFRTEWGDLEMTVEIVDSIQDAIDHIHRFGSGHTESIVTENLENAKLFLKKVDSACIFHNASTRFSDGFRFGLGAEVGISTKKIHARGPVGVMGLQTTRWKLASDSGHCVGDFSSAKGDARLSYTHKPMDILSEDDFELCQLK
eukprot:625033_1